MKTTAQKEINKIVDQLKKEYNPELILLFGSHARGSTHFDSDIDLLLIKNTRKRPVWRRVDALKIIDSDYPVDVIVYTPKEFNLLKKKGVGFIRDILSHGKILYEKKEG